MALSVGTCVDKVAHLIFQTPSPGLKTNTSNRKKRCLKYFIYFKFCLFFLRVTYCETFWCNSPKGYCSLHQALVTRGKAGGQIVAHIYEPVLHPLKTSFLRALPVPVSCIFVSRKFQSNVSVLMLKTVFLSHFTIFISLNTFALVTVYMCLQAFVQITG